jgi:hypothetical protein
MGCYELLFVCCLFVVCLFACLFVSLLAGWLAGWLVLPLQLFSQSRSGQKSSNRWVFRVFFKFPEQKHRKYHSFCASEAPKKKQKSAKKLPK